MKQLLHRRAQRERAHEAARAAGFAAAVGLDVEVTPDERGDTGRVCGHCGTVGRLDMVDATIARAFLTCPSCGRTWETGRLDQISTV